MENNLKRTAVSKTSGDNVVVAGIGIIALGQVSNSDAVGVKGEASAHSIVQNIAFRTHLGADGGLELDGVADLGGVIIAPVAGGILFDLFINVGRFVLFKHLDARGRGVQRAEGAEGGVNEVVAEVQVRESHGRAGRGLGCVFLNALLFRMRQRGFGKGSGVSPIDPGHIALCVDVHILGLLLQPRFPNGVRLVSICAVSISCRVIAFKDKNLVSFIGVAFHSVIDGDAAAVVVGAVRCKRGQAEGQGQREGQQQAQQLLDMFHGLFLPFSYLDKVFVPAVHWGLLRCAFRRRISYNSAAANRAVPPVVYSKVPLPPVSGSLGRGVFVKVTRLL